MAAKNITSPRNIFDPCTHEIEFFTPLRKKWCPCLVLSSVRSSNAAILSKSEDISGGIAIGPHMGTTFFVEGGKNFFSCVHGSKMAIGKVMFLAAVALVKGGEGGGGRIIYS